MLFRSHAASPRPLARTHDTNTKRNRSQFSGCVQPKLLSPQPSLYDPSTRSQTGFLFKPIRRITSARDPKQNFFVNQLRRIMKGESMMRGESPPLPPILLSNFSWPYRYIFVGRAAQEKTNIYIYIFICWEGGVGKRSEKVMQAILGREGGVP